MLIIGIDPGISGALCFMEQGKIVDVIDNYSGDAYGTEVTDVKSKSKTKRYSVIEAIVRVKEALRGTLTKNISQKTDRGFPQNILRLDLAHNLCRTFNLS